MWCKLKWLSGGILGCLSRGLLSKVAPCTCTGRSGPWTFTCQSCSTPITFHPSLFVSEEGGPVVMGFCREIFVKVLVGI